MEDRVNIKKSLLLLYSTNRKRQSYETMKQTQKYKYKQDAQEILDTTIDSLNAVGFRFDTVNLSPKSNDPLVDKAIPIKIISKDEMPKETTVKDVLLAKDEICLSDKRYHEFRKKLSISELPSLAIIKRKRKLLNSLFETFETDESGAYVNMKEKMGRIVRNLMSKQIISVNEPLRIKYSGDGARLGHVMQNLNVTFTILNEGKKAKTAFGNYLIGTFKIEKEDYTTLKKCLKGIIEQIEELNQITLDGNVFEIEKYFGGDLKFLALMLGINAANSNQPCIWCTYNSKTSHDNKTYREKTWSINDKKQGARSIEESIKTVERIKNGEKVSKNGYINLPLIESIPTNRYIIDMLHLFLRISDKLIFLFYENIQALDATDGYDPVNLNESSRVKKFLDHLSSKFKIQCPYKISKSIIELRSLRGPEKERIFLNIKLSDYTTGFTEIELLETIWNDFWVTYNLIKTNDLTANKVKTRTAQWMKKFRDVYAEAHVTPYMHSFEHHLHEIIRNEVDVNQFNQQGLEKLNSLNAYAYDHGTNKGKTYCTQLINRQNRLDLKNVDL